MRKNQILLLKNTIRMNFFALKCFKIVHHKKMAQFCDWSDFNTTILGGQGKKYFCFEPKTEKNGLFTNFAGKKEVEIKLMHSPNIFMAKHIIDVTPPPFSQRPTGRFIRFQRG
jgi:hypothetical protein